MKIAIIHGNDGSDVRVGKLCRTLSRLGHDVHFVGWDRRPDETKKIDLGLASSRLLIHPTQMGRATLGGQLQFALHIFKALKALRPNVVSCVNEDTALMVLPFKSVFYDSLICEIFDALVDRHSHRNWLVRKGLGIVSLLSRWRSDRLIVTDDTRFQRIGRHKGKCIVIENYPEDCGDDAALMPVVGPFKIFVSGSLNLNRGLRQVLSAIDAVDGFQIVSAGWLYDEFASAEFRAHPKVEFLGILTASETLLEAANCDAMFAFYAPTSTNNIYASPNKIFDAMSIGRPIITNSEIKVSRWTEENDLGWSCDYADEDGLIEILHRIEGNRPNLPKFADRARRMFLGKYSWGSMESKIESAYTVFSD